LTALAEGHFAGDAAVAEEDVLRAQVYHLLANHLSAAPTTAQLSELARLGGDATPLGRAISALARIAGNSTSAAISREYQDLFIGLGRGELVPYASYYLTGFLQEKPLARLRQDMARLGLKRDPSTSDPEDHAASVLQIMGGLVSGDFGTPGDSAAQRAFFETHVASWMPVFFRDLEAAKSSVFYAALASVGRAFLDVEDAAFAMA
jgi:TorA maturation chaperone TorD